MRDFPSETEIAISRARFETDLRDFAKRSASILRNSRKLPIRDAAIEQATYWLRNSVICKLRIPKGHVLLLAGDEHLEKACLDVLASQGIEYEFIFRTAFFEWLRKNSWNDIKSWWIGGTWTINDPLFLLDFASPFDSGLELIPNETYLCTEGFDDRGIHFLCWLENGGFKRDKISDWVDSI
jgi:hypothetical protein